MQVQSLGHVVLKVRSLDRSVPFYRDVLGLTEVGRFGDAMVFFSIAGNHHDIALQEVGDDAPVAPHEAPGLAHLALKIGDDLGVLRAAKDHLQAHGAEILRLRDHAVSQSIYFSDPDGNVLEVFVDADPAIWRDDPAKVATSLPLELN
jgi:catechol 2,3-dioxygenase